MLKPKTYGIYRKMQTGQEQPQERNKGKRSQTSGDRETLTRNNHKRQIGVKNRQTGKYTGIQEKRINGQIKRIEKACATCTGLKIIYIVL